MGAGSLVLLASMFLLKWYGLSGGGSASQPGQPGGEVSVNGWHGLTTWRWFMLATILIGLALVFFQTTRRAPAIPVTLSAFVTFAAAITLLGLIYRVLINAPGPDNIDTKAGAYIGLVATLVIVWGGYRSMRQEGVREADGPGEIPTIPLSSAPLESGSHAGS